MDIEIRDASELAKSFWRRFPKIFDNVSIEEKKELLRRIIVGINYDPDKREATCVITKIPMINPASSAVSPPEFVSGICSGGMHFSLLSTMHYVIEMPLNKIPQN